VRRAARVLLYLGAAGVVLGLSKYHAAYIGHYDFTNSFRFAWAISYIVLLALAAYGVGLPDLPRSTRVAVLSALGSTAAAAIGISILQLVAGSTLLPRFVVLGTPLVLVPWYFVCWALASSARTLQEDRDRIVAVVSLEEADALRAELSEAPEKAASLVDTLLLADARSDQPRQRPLVESVVRNGATVVVLDREAQGDESIVGQAAALHESGIRVRTLTLFYDEWLGKLPVWELERVSLMFDIGELHRARYGRFKRLVDLGISVVALAALIVVIPFVFLGSLIANRGPLFYRQTRVGKNGTTFQILKFRTMRPEGADMPSEWTTEDDPRITPFGGLLRRTHVDELPQLVNVLRGEMSLVGPRPLPMRDYDRLQDWHKKRYLVLPGMTGLWQVSGRAELDFDDLVRLDFLYLERWSVALDLSILLKTIPAVLSRRGAY
jgi:exopolysaccharide biosynthesis polyprenyl glycosylphosphotransferase